MNKDLTHFESLYPSETREVEIEKTLDFLKSGKSCQVIGLPGSGRSNFLQLLSYNKNVRLKHLGENQKWYHFVYMDFSEVRKRSLFDVVKFILISIAYSLSERGYEEDHQKVNEFLKEAVSMNDELILFQALKRSIDYLAIEKELNVILLFDRFEQYTPDITEQFFLNLKILRNRAKYRFSTIYSLSRPLEEILEVGIISEFYEYVASNHIYLRIHDPIGTSFRMQYVEKITGKKVDEKINKQLLSLTGGHNKLLLIGFEQELSEENPQKDLQEYLLKNNRIHAALLDIWNFLSTAEQAVIRKVIKSEEVHVYSNLEKMGLVKDQKITIPLFEKFVEGFLEEKTSEILSYDTNTNEIKKGNDDITELLSPSEFRLLRYLIINNGKVCEKNELIEAVWKDSKTQEGVTDQALDQIIYRLRKKIEEDPNNPTHLQTIKGRGVKFIP